jgi:predicted RNase H-like HicB family nuclease
LKIVEWSEEDGCYVGTCPGVVYGGVHGDDEIKVYRELCEVVAEAVALFEADGRPLPPPTAHRDYSGKFVLRVGKDLHKRLAIRALREGESLNSYCLKVLRDAV